MKDENPYEYGNGDKVWFLGVMPHRFGGPAIETANGDKYWFIYYELNREDGPAVELATGEKQWWLIGVRLTEQEFEKRINSSEVPEILEHYFESKK